MSLTNQIKEYLAEEGLRPQEEEFGLFFRYQMLSFLVHTDDDDERFLKISLPHIFDTDENNRVDALEAMNAVNRDWKIVKLLLLDDSVWVTAEQLLDSTPELGDVIPRTLTVLMQARDAFYEELKNIQ